MKKKYKKTLKIISKISIVFNLILLLKRNKNILLNNSQEELIRSKASLNEIQNKLLEMQENERVLKEEINLTW